VLHNFSPRVRVNTPAAALSARSPKGAKPDSDWLFRCYSNPVFRG
jgi:hypothetical protein